MSMTVKCPECHATLLIQQTGEAGRLRCPHCQAVLRWPDDGLSISVSRSMGGDTSSGGSRPLPAFSRSPVLRNSAGVGSGSSRPGADNLNNQAVSLLSLGKPAGAEVLLDKLLRMDPNHPQGVFNRGLLHWRSGRLTDLGLIRQLEELRRAHPEDWHPAYYLGLVHTERGDIEAAIAQLEDSIRLGGGAEVEPMLQRVRALLPQTVRCAHVLPGHAQAVKAVALTEDARYALSGSGDGTFLLWDLATGTCVQTVHTNSHGCACLVLNPQARWVLCANTTLALYDLADGRCLRTFQGHNQPVTSLSLSADGSLALSGSWDQTVRLWEVATGRCVRTFEGHTSPITCVFLSADGRLVLSGSAGRELWMWDASNGHRVRTFEGQECSAECICLSRDGRWVLSGDADAKLHLWSTKNGLRVRTLRGHLQKVSSVALSADGRWALSGSLDQTLRLWDVTTGCCVRTLEGHQTDVLSVSLSADGRRGISGGGESSASQGSAVRVWDFEIFHGPGGRFVAPPARCPTAGKEEPRPGQSRFDGMLFQARALADARRFDEALYLIEQARRIPSFGMNPQALDLRAAVGQQGVRERFRDGRCVRVLRMGTSPVGPVALSPDASHALTGGSDKLVRLWNLATSECELVLAGHTAAVADLCFVPDRRQALSASEDGTVRLWDLASGTCQRVLQGHTGWVSCVAASPDGRWAVSGGRDKTLRLWDLATGVCMRSFTGHANLIRSVRFSPCARWVLSGSFDKTLRRWDLASGQCTRCFEGHTEIVHSVCLSADGRWAISGGNDRSVRVWEVSTGHCARVMQEHFERVLSVAVTADGHFAVSASGDKQLRLWSLAQGQCVQVLSGHSGVVTSVDLSPDGRWLVSASHDQTVRLWELEWDYSFPEPEDWHEAARPYLEDFLVLHTPYQEPLPEGREPSEQTVRRALSRAGKPSWTEDDFQRLLATLRIAGFGWLRPEGVRRTLEQFAAQTS